MLSGGRQLGPYRVISFLAAGGMGEVYRAEDVRLGREVALKVLPPPFAEDARRRARFEREARLVAGLEHPNILVLHDFGEEAGISYVVTELLEGETLQARLKRGRLPWRAAVRIGSEIAEGLAAAHGRGVVHRDLKPGNVFLTRDGRVKILDFGLAQSRRPDPGEASGAPTESMTVTRTGMVMGTPGYMAPEQAEGKPVDTRTDLYSFGCMMYEMLAGEAPFRRTEGGGAGLVVAGEEPPALPSGLDYPPALGRVIERCLRREPVQRYQSAHDLSHALRELLTGSELASIPRPGRRLRIGLWGVAAAMLVLLAVAAGLWGWMNNPEAVDRSGRIRSLAVLPLVNLSGDSEQEYFAHGMTRSLITDLSQISALDKVIGYVSVMTYLESPKSPREIAHELGVDGILEGSVQHAGNRVMIDVQLLDAATGSIVWANAHETEYDNILSLRSTLARTIAREVGVALTPSEIDLLESKGPINSMAYDLVQRGNYFYQRYTPESFEKALEYYHQAIDVEPDYFGGYLGIADYYGAQAYWGLQDPRDVLPKLREYIERAAQCPNSETDVAGARAMDNLFFQWNWEEAKRGLETWRQNRPNDPRMLPVFAFYYSVRGRRDDVVHVIQRARVLDPHNPNSVGLEGWFLVQVGKMEEGEGRLNQALEMDPKNGPARFGLWNLYHVQGREREALEMARSWLGMRPDSEAVLRAMEEGEAAGGYREAMRRGAESLAQQSADRYVPPTLVARLFLYSGDQSSALDWLEKGFEARDAMMIDLANNEWRPLHHSPRLQALAKRMDLPLPTNGR